MGAQVEASWAQSRCGGGGEGSSSSCGESKRPLVERLALCLPTLGRSQPAAESPADGAAAVR